MEEKEMKVLFPGKEVTVNNEVICIKPFKFGKLPQVLKVMQQIAGAAQKHINAGTISTPEGLMEIAAQGGEDLTKLMAMNIGKEVSWFDEVESDEGLELLLAFIEVNFSFFIERILPMINKKMEGLNEDSKAQIGKQLGLK